MQLLIRALGIAGLCTSVLSFQFKRHKPIVFMLDHLQHIRRRMGSDDQRLLIPHFHCDRNLQV